MARRPPSPQGLSHRQNSRTGSFFFAHSESAILIFLDLPPPLSFCFDVVILSTLDFSLFLQSTYILMLHRHPFLVFALSLLPSFASAESREDQTDFQQARATFWSLEKARVLQKAEELLPLEPETITAHPAKRSAGGRNDYFSEGRYWWPNPKNPDAPYQRRDGETNPDTFVAHREVMVRLAEISGTLASCYILTGEARFAEALVPHLNAWFVDEETRMTPHLLYGQAVQGHCTGRSIGIIDTLHLIEVALAFQELISADDSFFTDTQETTIRGWFRQYLTWMNTHEYGLKEKVYPNNHGIAWSLQAAVFARVVDDSETLAWVQDQFQEEYLGRMMDDEGGFTAELKRTKPFGYSLFVMDLMAGIAQIASNDSVNLSSTSTPDGKNLQLGELFLLPYVRDKTSWPLRKDIQYWDDWPVRQAFLWLGAHAREDAELLNLANGLEPDPEAFEIRRNLPIRHPALWGVISGESVH